MGQKKNQSGQQCQVRLYPHPHTHLHHHSVLQSPRTGCLFNSSVAMHSPWRAPFKLTQVFCSTYFNILHFLSNSSYLEHELMLTRFDSQSVNQSTNQLVSELPAEHSRLRESHRSCFGLIPVLPSAYHTELKSFQ